MIAKIVSLQRQLSSGWKNIYVALSLSNKRREDVLPAVLLSLSHDRVYSTRIASLFSNSWHRSVESLGRLKIRNCLSSGVVTSRFTESTKKLAFRMDRIVTPNWLYRFAPLSEIVREIPAVHQLLSNVSNRNENRASFKLPLARDTQIYSGLNRGRGQGWVPARLSLKSCGLGWYHCRRRLLCVISYPESRVISIADLNYLANFTQYRLYTNRDFSYPPGYLNCLSNSDAAVSSELEHEISFWSFFI